MAQRKRGTKLGRSILAGVNEALSYARGEAMATAPRATTFHIPRVDVKRVRSSIGMSQAEFAKKFGFSVGTLRNWEQGRRDPEVSARILLAVIERHPEAVEDVLRG